MNMTYEETIELEENVKLKNKAQYIYKQFKNNITLAVFNYEGEGRFLHWSDSHNKVYFIIEDSNIFYECKYLHEYYKVECTPSGIFSALRRKCRGVEHLEIAVRDK